MRTLAITEYGAPLTLGLTHREMPLNSYRDVVATEASIVGSADHLASEICVGVAAVDALPPDQSALRNSLGSAPADSRSSRSRS